MFKDSQFAWWLAIKQTPGISSAVLLHNNNNNNNNDDDDVLIMFY